MSAALLFFVLFLICFWLIFSDGPAFEAPKTSRLPDGEDKYYQAAKSLFVNKSERAFFIILSQALGADYLLMSKTRLEDVVGVNREIKDAKLRWSLRGRVKSRHVDFLVCARDGAPRMGIELDGSSHRDASTDNADDLKDRIFAAAGVPFMRVLTDEDFHLAASRIRESLKP